MNPNMMNNFTPQQMEQFKSMMTPDMMKSMTSQFMNMPDEQLKFYLNSMGMGHMDPQTFRNMSQNINNMNDNDINRIKNTSPTFNQFNQNQSVPQTSVKEPKKNETWLDKLNRIKNEGNDLFRSGRYSEGSQKYYECIGEVKTSSDMARNAFGEQLMDIERACRLNIANCKLKTKEYDTVISECLIVLEKTKCFKAYFRMGLAYLYKENYEKAQSYLDNANAIGDKGEKTAVEPYLSKCNEEMRIIKEKKRKEREDKKVEEEKENAKEKEKERKNHAKEKEQNSTGINNDTNASAKESPISKEQTSVESSKQNANIPKKNENSRNDDDIKVEPEQPAKQKEAQTMHASRNPYQNQSQSNWINQAKERISTMDESQLNSMCDMMKAMDNSTLKQMMSAQGMNMSDQEIEMMKTSINPEMFKMMQNPAFSQMAMQGMQNPCSVGTSSPSNPDEINPTTAHQTQSPPRQMPPLPNINNMDYSQMLNFLKSNPEMLKMISPQWSSMFGGKEADPNWMMNALEKILWIFSIPGKIKRFFTSFRGICITILVLALIIGFIYR